MSNTARRPRGPMGGHGKGMPGEKAKDFKGAMKRLVKYMERYKFRLMLMILFAVGGTVFNIVGPKILGKATTELFNGLVSKINGGSGINFDKIVQILLGCLCLYLVSALLSFIQGFIMTGISNDVTYNLRKDISEKINRIPMKYFESRTHGEILSRITNDVDTLQMGINQSVTQLITSVAQIVGVTIQMLSLSVALAAVTFLTVPISLVAVIVVVRASQRHFRRQQALLGQADGIIEESFSGQTVIQVFNRRERAVSDFDTVNGRLFDSGWRSQFLSGLMMPLMNFVANLGYVGVVVAGAFLAIGGSIQIGDVQAFMQYVRNFTQPITQLSQVSNMLQMLSAAAERVFDFLAEDEEPPDVEAPAEARRGQLRPRALRLHPRAHGDP